MQYPQKYNDPEFSSPRFVSIDQLLHYFDINNVCRRDPCALQAAESDKYLFESIHLTDRSVRTALYMSKMTIADELRDGPLEFSHIRFVEFLEFIGRIAHRYF